MAAVENSFALFDGDGGSAILLSDYRRSVCFDDHGGGTEGNGNLASVFARFEAAAANGEWVVVAADYALGAWFEPVVTRSIPDRPMLRGWVFGQAQRLEPEEIAGALDRYLDGISAHDRVAGVAELSPALDAAFYAAKVEQVLRWIADGDCYQINLTFPLDFRIYGHPMAFYCRLRMRQPVCYGGMISVPGETLLSFSPELFFERTGNRVVTRPMKGTASRGANPQEDEARRQELLASEKERAENIMIVDLLRNDLGRLAHPGGVVVEALCAAEPYPTLWQVVSTVAADLPGASLFDLFRALFPCGSITGAPKIAAMQKIAALEERPRRLYTGTLGWLAPSGNCRFNVAIRTVELTDGGYAKMGVGSGIVIDSEPAREYSECLLKASFLTGYDPGFELIETMRLEGGEYPLLPLHLKRLQGSARALGFACDLQAISLAVAQQAASCTAGSYRVRLTLAHDGGFALTRAPLAHAESSWQVVLADERLDANDYLLRHKTTARSRYDRALARLAADPAILDTIFLNALGEVCEGARSNVFVERDGILLTPPQSCGLLPGVMRRQLLDSGRAVEQILTWDDVLGAPALYVANAVRGLIPVTVRR